MRVVIEKGRYRVVTRQTSLRANGQPLGFVVEAKRGREWKQVAFKVQRDEALRIFAEKVKVSIK